MDQSLKQRLIGVTIVVALVIIFVPMLFEKSEDREKFSSTGIPSIPDDVMEKNIELPKTAEDVGPKEEEEKKAEDHGYKIVPMNEEPSPKPKLAEESNAKPAPGQEGDIIEDKPVSLEELQSKSEADKPIGKAKRETHANPSKVPAKSPSPQVSEPLVKHLAPVKPSPRVKSGKTTAPKTQRHANEHEDDVDARSEPAPSPARTEVQAVKKPPKTTTGYAPRQGHGVETKQGIDTEPKPTATKKTSTLKPPEPRKPKSKLKENKANPYDAQPDADMDLDGEPIPVPAKPVTAPAKPKPVVTTKPKSTGTSVTKPVEAAKATPKTTPKSSEASHPANKAEKPDAPSPDTNATPAKPKAVKPSVAKPTPVKSAPASVKPTKPAEPEKQPVKPQTVAPDR